MPEINETGLIARTRWMLANIAYFSAGAMAYGGKSPAVHVCNILSLMKPSWWDAVQLKPNITYHGIKFITQRREGSDSRDIYCTIRFQCWSFTFLNRLSASTGFYWNLFGVSLLDPSGCRYARGARQAEVTWPCGQADCHVAGVLPLPADDAPEGASQLSGWTGIYERVDAAVEVA